MWYYIIEFALLSLASMQARTADDRIEEATATLRLHLSYCRLRSIDSRAFSLDGLTLLDVGHNRLQSLPPQVGLLLCLRELWINHNPELTALPSEIVACKQLALIDARVTGMVKVCWCI